MLITLRDFDIAQIANSGQCFRIGYVNNHWEVLAFSKRLVIKDLGKSRYDFYCSDEEFENIWSEYFDLKTNYGTLKKEIESFGDPYLNQAIRYGHGIRILKQDLWEVIVSFIISQRNNIPRIKGIIGRLCKQSIGFPSAQDLSGYTLRDFEDLGMGYRASYLVELVRDKLSGKLDLEKLIRMDNREKALSYLKSFRGIGDKVANCILLFGLHRIDSFPRDVWINRIVETRYGGNFPIERFNGFQGIVQQYIFFYERFLNGVSPLKL